MTIPAVIARSTATKQSRSIRACFRARKKGPRGPSVVANRRGYWLPFALSCWCCASAAGVAPRDVRCFERWCIRLLLPLPPVMPSPLPEVAPVPMSLEESALALTERMHEDRAESTVSMLQSLSVKRAEEAASLRCDEPFAKTLPDSASATAADIRSALFMGSPLQKEGALPGACRNPRADVLSATADRRPRRRCRACPCRRPCRGPPRLFRMRCPLHRA